ncbi:MAG: tripartite tricarboxylate transporter TctB family protein [Deltaproteobacteria bacterium]|nr:tripartite tricarboxylate transporter TctB family protein [Deltaproteobacteria bacterium]
MQTTAEILIAAGVALLAVVFYTLGNFTQSVNPDDPGPGFYPRTLSILLLIAALAQIVLSWRKKRESHKKEMAVAERSGFSYRVFFGTALLSVLYGFVFDKASYLITTTCFLLAMMMLGGVRKWHVLLSVAVGYSVATYYLFGHVLMVQLK